MQQKEKQLRHDWFSYESSSQKGIERNSEGWVEGILSNTKFGLCGNHYMRPGYIFDMKEGRKKILEVIVHHEEEGIGGIIEGWIEGIFSSHYEFLNFKVIQ